MSLAAKLVQQDEGEHRAADRVPVDLGATLRDASAMPIDATIHDLSISGFLAQSSAGLAVNALFSVGLSGLAPNSARVVWKDGDLYGCAFTRQLTMDDVERALTAATVAQVDFGGRPRESERDGAAQAPAKAPSSPISRRNLMLIVGSSAALWAGIWKASLALLA